MDHSAFARWTGGKIHEMFTGITSNHSTMTCRQVVLSGDGVMMSYFLGCQKGSRTHLVKLGCVTMATAACFGMPVYISMHGASALVAYRWRERQALFHT